MAAERFLCPICEDVCFQKPKYFVKDILVSHPYVECLTCGFWYQQTLITKVYEAFHEVSGDLMSDHEKNVNYQIAERLFNAFLKEKKLSTALDIGAKFPWLMHCLNLISKNKVQTWAIDGIPEIEYFVAKHNLHVAGRMCDFEEAKEYPWHDLKFDLITMVHIIEHFYNPIETMRKVYDLLEDEGKLFIRCPSSDVQGIERDFTIGHYDIHPQIWNKKSLEAMAKKVGFDILLNMEVIPGQRDLILARTRIRGNHDLHLA